MTRNQRQNGFCLVSMTEFESIVAKGRITGKFYPDPQDQKDR